MIAFNAGFFLYLWSNSSPLFYAEEAGRLMALSGFIHCWWRFFGTAGRNIWIFLFFLISGNTTGEIPELGNEGVSKIGVYGLARCFGGRGTNRLTMSRPFCCHLLWISLSVCRLSILTNPSDNFRSRAVLIGGNTSATLYKLRNTQRDNVQSRRLPVQPPLTCTYTYSMIYSLRWIRVSLYQHSIACESDVSSNTRTCDGGNKLPDNFPSSPSHSRPIGGTISARLYKLRKE